jgi:hypothetical protein
MPLLDDLQPGGSDEQRELPDLAFQRDPVSGAQDAVKLLREWDAQSHDLEAGETLLHVV